MHVIVHFQFYMDGQHYTERQTDRQTERVNERENTPYLVKCDDVHGVSMSAVCCSLGGHAEAQRQVRHRVHDHALKRLIYRGEYSEG